MKKTTRVHLSRRKLKGTIGRMRHLKKRLLKFLTIMTTTWRMKSFPMTLHQKMSKRKCGEVELTDFSSERIANFLQVRAPLIGIVFMTILILYLDQVLEVSSQANKLIIKQ